MNNRIRVFLICLAVFVTGLMLYGHFNPERMFALSQKFERNAAHLELKKTTVKGLEITYLEGGTGEPLILIHGFGADKDNWTRVAKYMTPYFRVIAPDLPGFGNSVKKPDLDYSLKGQAKWLNDFAGVLNLSGFHLGGSSMGGAISGVYASMYPAQVKSLWLIAPGAVNTPVESELKLMLKTGKNPLIAETPEQFKKMLDFLFCKKPFIPQAIVKMLGKQSAENKGIKDIVFKAVHDNPVWIDDLLQGSQISTLILWGDRDRVLHVSGAGILSSKMAAANSVIMKNAGHLPMIERPKEAAETYLKFQRKI